MSPFYLLVIFIVSSTVGYKLIKNVPSLLHTPLMSGMNAIHGVVVLGALTSTIAAVRLENSIIGVIAITLATINVVAGFTVTGRMLKMFHHKNNTKEADK